MSAKRKNAASSRTPPEIPSSSAPDDGSPRLPTDAAEVNRRNWRDEILRSGARLLLAVNEFPGWQKRLDLSRLAIEIARSRPGTTPGSCLREASELMLATEKEIEWMGSGRVEEDRALNNAEAARLTEKMLEGIAADPWSDPVKWEQLCYDGLSKKPDSLEFPDGSTFEAYSRTSRLRALVKDYFEATPNRGDYSVEGWLKAARSQKLSKSDIHPIALFRTRR